jgi:prepilin-type N-terminal cleavage/methylation domain-containing protein
MPDATRSQAGFTLVELLVALSVMSIIGAALASALFVGLRTSGDTQTSLDQSNAELALSSALTRDVQNACRSGPGCANPNPGTAPDHVCGHDVAFAMNVQFDPLAHGAELTVGYAHEGKTIVRYECDLGASVPLESHTVVAGHVTDIAVIAPGTGACVGQFQVHTKLGGSAAGVGTHGYEFDVCAHARAA